MTTMVADLATRPELLRSRTPLADRGKAYLRKRVPQLVRHNAFDLERVADGAEDHDRGQFGPNPARTTRTSMRRNRRSASWPTMTRGLPGRRSTAPWSPARSASPGRAPVPSSFSRPASPASLPHGASRPCLSLIARAASCWSRPGSRSSSFPISPTVRWRRTGTWLCKPRPMHSQCAEPVTRGRGRSRRSRCR
jgi:hypothetical protein